MKLHMTGHVAVVTGGASGIGRAIAVGFRAEGCRVIVWDADPDVEESAAGIEALGLQVDVSDHDAVADALRQTEAGLGEIDHVVHAAAVGSGKIGSPFTNLDVDDWAAVLEVNVLGMVNVAHAVTPGMIERRRGTMVFLASVAGQIGSPTDPPYSASKAANINFAQCMARDLAKYGIRVNSVCPGMVKTPLNESVWKAWHDNQPAGPEALR